MTKLEQLFADLATLLGPLRSIVTLHPDEALAANRAVVTLRDENPGDLIQKHFEDKHKELLAADAEDDETEAEATDTPETDETSATAPETGVSVEPVNEGAPIISDTPMNAETGTESTDPEVQAAESIDGQPAPDGETENLNDDPVVSTTDGTAPVTEVQDTENTNTLTQAEKKPVKDK